MLLNISSYLKKEDEGSEKAIYGKERASLIEKDKTSHKHLGKSKLKC